MGRLTKITMFTAEEESMDRRYDLSIRDSCLAVYRCKKDHADRSILGSSLGQLLIRIQQIRFVFSTTIRLKLCLNSLDR